MWLKHDQCEEVVKEVWEAGMHMGGANPIEAFPLLIQLLIKGVGYLIEPECILNSFEMKRKE